MKKVVGKMCDQLPKRFFWFNIFLTAYTAISAGNFSIAIKTVFFFAGFSVRQCLKNFTKNTQGILSGNIYLAASFFVTDLIKRFIMQKSVLLLTLLFVFCNVRAQYYYNDVAALKASNNIYFTLKKNNVQQVSALSKENDNTPAEGFVYLKILKNNASLVITHTQLETGEVSDEYDTYLNNVLVKSSDSTDNILTTVEYTYDSAGNTLMVQTQTDDTAMNTHSTEVHKWFYSGNVPDSMIKIKDNEDSTVIHFKTDEDQNISEEIWLKKGRVLEHYYYYYNNKNQLTDIVRFNTKAQQMLPDFLFAYNENGILSQLTQVPEGSSDYVIWQYVYDERGLKTKDVLFDKHQELLGTITYSYQ